MYMKRILWIVALTACAVAAATAQNPYLSPVGMSDQNGIMVVADPHSQIAVDLQVEEEQIIAGPYARYAQKLLGVRAPLTDKTNFRIAGAQIALLADDSYLYAGQQPEAHTRVVSHAEDEKAFARIQPDKTDMAVLPQENAAKEAAKTIFLLRKRRLELITGETGEHVFGQGLQAALDEIARLEQEYLELFLGKQIVSTSNVRMAVSLKGDQTQYPLCRLNASEGIVPATASAGVPVTLKITPSGHASSPLELGAKDKSPSAPYRLADIALCTVLNGDAVLTQTMLPLFEFGRTIHIALPAAAK